MAEASSLMESQVLLQLHSKHMLSFALLFFSKSPSLVVAAVHGDGEDHGLLVGLFFQPLLLRLLSVSAHLALFPLLLFLWCRATHIARVTNIAPTSRERRTGARLPLLSYLCLGLSIFHLFFCIFNYVWFMHGWASDHTTTTTTLVLLLELDLILRVVAWFATAAFLHFQFSTATIRRCSFRFPLLLRIWWTLFPLFSALLLVIDLVNYGNLVDLRTDLEILDSGSVLFGLLIAYAGLFGAGGGEESTILQEPLLVSSNGTCLFSNANLLSILTFSWMNPLLSVGYRKPIDLEDVPNVAYKDSTRGVVPIFNSYLDSCCDKGSRLGTLCLAKALVLSTWQLIAFTGACCLLNVVASFVGPYLIDYFVQYLYGNGESKWYEGYALVLAFVLSKIIECLSQRHWYFRLHQAGVRARTALVAIIYKKSLNLSSSSRQSLASGEIVNLISVDADRIGLFSWYMHDLWIVPVQVTLGLLILYANLGLASIAAFVATVVVMLVNVPLGKILENNEERLMESKDTRMKATSEILRNMKILKLQAWEMKFLSKIKELRKKETGWLRKYVYTSAVTTFFFWAAPTFVSIVTFGACLLMGIPLESGKVLSALATFRVLQEPIYNLPDTISMVIQTKVSLDRIASFLCLDDLQTDIIERFPRGMLGLAVQVTNGSFSWDPTSKTPTLMDLNFQVLQGMRVAVCGTVGSGKSTLLSCILGEVPKVSGNARVCGTIAYVAQSPWIQSGKVEDNILFGEKMDRKRYELILEVCSLKKDLEILPFGDQTMIGERGINLSGGQKQRIQIARALYQDADIFLFDDPFSAVDAHTGSHLFKECLLGLLDTKAVIYVTHQVEFLPSADLILVMKNGRIQQAGKYHDLLDSGSDFLELVGAHDKALSTLRNMDVANSSNSIAEGKCGQIGFSLEMVQKEDEKDGQNGDVSDTNEKKGQLIQAEEREKGKVGFPVYWKYMTASYRGALVLPILLAQVLFQILEIGSNYWITWASSLSKETEAPVNSANLIYVYVALALGSSVCVLVRAVLLVTAGYKSATLLFNQMHACIFHAPMSFFDSTPSGRILNRASTDQNEVDMSVAYQIGSFAFSVIRMLGIIAVMSQVAWQVFVVFIPVAIACVLYQNYYIATARELSRLTGICKAPIIQHFVESLSGCTTIRSFNQETRFVNKNFELSDAYSRPTIHNAGAMEWLCFRLDILSCMTFAFALVLLISLPTGTIDPGFAGLAVTYGLNLNMIQSWVIWSLCNLENKIVSVERILQYTCIPSEPPLVIDKNKPDNGWPSDGKVEIYNLQVRYAPHMPLVLKGLTCTFHGGKRTGIVGRTGSGKSTLIQTLFRLVDPAYGQILIDGIDISKIGLHDLRSKLSIIPQDPTMFEGTVRGNLDPLEEYSDAQIWEALHKCQLGEEVQRKEGKLDSAVIENGENWSVGQRQLVCLARVTLKKNKILVLDEATASVDTATDNWIQRTIKEQFSDSTVITIAHRITSVLDSDMIVLLDNGIIAECDHPSNLLENKSSLFSKLVFEYTMRSSSSRAEKSL